MSEYWEIYIYLYNLATAKEIFKANNSHATKVQASIIQRVQLTKHVSLA